MFKIRELAKLFKISLSKYSPFKNPKIPKTQKCSNQASPAHLTNHKQLFWIASILFATYISSKVRNSMCEKSQIIYKQINKAHTLEYPANNPIEDRTIYIKLNSIPAELAAVFDGHGGFAVCFLKSRSHLQNIRWNLRN